MPTLGAVRRLCRGQPRHPSQLYEAALEGVLLAVVLGIVARNGGFRHPGLLTGLFTVGYALARIAMEFFREPDSEIEQLAHGLTMGMVLSGTRWRQSTPSRRGWC